MNANTKEARSSGNRAGLNQCQLLNHSSIPADFSISSRNQEKNKESYSWDCEKNSSEARNNSATWSGVGADWMR
jgi:hypothetical protein